MKKTRYTDKQIALALRQAEADTRVSEVCRKIGVSEQTRSASLRAGSLAGGSGSSQA